MPLGEDVEGKSHVAVRVVIFCLSGGPSVTSPRVLHLHICDSKLPTRRLVHLINLSHQLAILINTRKRLLIFVLFIGNISTTIRYMFVIYIQNINTRESCSTRANRPASVPLP
jgi:hypothetical protein